MTSFGQKLGLFFSGAALALLSGCGSGGTTIANSPATASLSTTAITFANTNTGSTSLAQTVILSNTGTTALSVTGITIAGSNPSAFSLSSNNCGTTVAGGASCSFAITFSPPTAASFLATVNVADNATGSPQIITLSGTGIVPGTPVVSLSTSSFNALTILVGSIAAEQITVTNTGSGSLNISAVNITGTNATSFSITSNTCGSGILAANSCSLVVTFAPTAVGSYSATLNITDNAAGSPQQVALSGKAVLESNSCTTLNTTSPTQPSPTQNYPGIGFSGKVMAGSLPVIGATVQIYAAGTTGNGSTPVSLYTSAPTSSTGAFTVPATFTCPYSNTVLYAVARGGQAGATGTVNAGIVLSSVLGVCNSLSASATYTIDEVTTAATAWTMSQFLASGGKIGATATNSSGIVLAAGTFANLVNPLSGAAPGAYFPATGTAPAAKLNQVANLLNSCIVSAGASSAACTQLYSLTATSSGTPSNTLDAAMNLAKNPGTNVAALYAQSATSTAYSPALTAAPMDWTLFVTFGGGGMSDPSAVSIDSTGRVWAANYNSVVSLFSNTGVPVFASGVSGVTENSYGGSVDYNDVMWVASEQSTYSLNTGLGIVTLLNNSGPTAFYSSGGLNFPIAVSFDTSGIAWVVDYGNSHVTTLTNSGTPASGASGYTSAQFVFPVAVATDSKCNAYIANQSSNTITFVSADGSTYGSYAVGNGPSGIAVDGSGNVWSSNYYDNTMGILGANGKILSGTGISGGGIDHPQGIAIDGNGTAWVANYRSPAGTNSVMSEFAGAGTASPGAALSPATGWGEDAGMLEPFAVAIDAGGNIWISNFATNTLTEFIGMAAPVKTPLLGPVRVP